MNTYNFLLRLAFRAIRPSMFRCVDGVQKLYLAVLWVLLISAAPQTAFSQLFQNDYTSENSPLSPDPDDLDYQSLLDQIGIYDGRLVPRSEQPIVYEILDRSFAKLAEAQKNVGGYEFPALNYLLLIDHPSANAKVFMMADRQVGYQKNIAVVHTGLFRHTIHKLYPKLSPVEQTRRSLEVVQGVLAHELAHPINGVDKRGGIPWNLTQAVETRADVEAILLLREAGITEQGLIDFYKHEDLNHFPEPSDSFNSSHPHTTIRSSVIQVVETSERYEKGFVPREDLRLSERQIEAVHKIGKIHPSLDLNQSLLDLIQNFQDTHYIQGDVDSHAHPYLFQKNLIYLNQLVLLIDQTLDDRGDDLSIEEIGALRKYFEVLRPLKTDGFSGYRGRSIKDASFYVFQTSDWQDYARESPWIEFDFPFIAAKGGDTNAPKSHFDYLKGSVFYRSELHMDWVAKYYRTTVLDDSFVLPLNYSYGWDWVHTLVPPDLAPRLEETIVEDLRRMIDPREREGNFLSITSRIEPPQIYDRSLVVYLNYLFFTRIYNQETFPTYLLLKHFGASEYSREERLNWRDKKTDYSLTYFRYYLHVTVKRNIQKYIDGPISRAREEILQNASEEDLKRLRAIAKTMWQRRAELAVVSAFFQSGSGNPDPSVGIDWEMVFRLLPEIGGAEAGYHQIAEAVKEYTSSKAYAEFAARKIDGFQFSWRGIPLPWLSLELIPYLRGDHNPGIAGQPVDQMFLDAKSTAILYRYYPGYGRKELYESIKRSLEKLEGLTLEEAKDSDKIFTVVEKSRKRKVFHLPPLDLFARAVKNSNLGEEVKIALLREYYFIPADTYPRALYLKPVKWIINARQKRTTATINILAEYGLTTGIIDYLHQNIFDRTSLDRDYSPNLPSSHDREENLKRYFKLLHRHHKKIIQELEEQFEHGSTEEFLDFVQRTLRPVPGYYPDGMNYNRSKNLRKIRARALELILKLDLNNSSLIDAFVDIVSSGGSDSTDRYFEKNILPRLTSNDFDPSTRKKILQLFSKQRETNKILSRRVRLELFKIAFAEQQRALHHSPTFDASFLSFISNLVAHLPESFPERDDYLEELAWEFGIEDQDILKILEDYKTVNWRRLDYAKMNLGSAVAAIVHRLNPNEATQLIHYILDPVNHSIPRRVEHILREDSRARQLSWEREELGETGMGESLDAAIEADIENRLLTLELWALDATADEKVPVINHILNTGKPALVDTPNYIERVGKDLLGFDEMSETKREAWLSFFAEGVLPTVERSITLSYQIAHHGDTESELLWMFEPFGTLGAAAAQFISNWPRILGNESSEKIRDDLKDSKDNYKPLTRAEVVEALEERLEPKEFAKIKRIIRIVGSAKLKTVVLVEIEDHGETYEAVAAIQKPYVREQLEANILVGKRFLAELERRNLKSQSSIVTELLEALEAQLTEALDMRVEVSKIDKARQAHDGYRLGTTGWKLEVPAPVRMNPNSETLSIIEYAGEGVETLNQNERAVPPEVMELFVRRQIRWFYETGYFNPDTHSGNVLVDHVQKILNLIDFEQLQVHPVSRNPLSADVRYEFAKFIEAIALRDAQDIVENSRSWFEFEGRGKEAAIREVMDYLEGRLSDENLITEEIIIELVEGYASKGFRSRPEISFGLFKGLLILIGEQYVSSERFLGILQEETRRFVIRHKLPRRIIDHCKATLQSIGKPNTTVGKSLPEKK